MPQVDKPAILTAEMAGEILASLRIAHRHKMNPAHDDALRAIVGGRAVVVPALPARREESGEGG